MAAESETREGAGAPATPVTAARQAVMALCAAATGAELDTALAAVGYAGPVQELRRPETGLVMVRGRAGGDGRRFNLGEATGVFFAEPRRLQVLLPPRRLSWSLPPVSRRSRLPTRLSMALLATSMCTCPRLTPSLRVGVQDHCQ